MDNPFAKVAESDPEAAKVLACALAASVTECEVYACLRMARRLGLGRVSVWLSGSLFDGFVDHYDGCIERFDDLQPLARNYLESLNV